MAEQTTKPMEIAERELNEWALKRLGLSGQDVRCLSHFEGYIPRELSPMLEEFKRIVGGVEAVNDPSGSTTDLQLAVTALDPIAETAGTVYNTVPNASNTNSGAMTPEHVEALETVVQGLADEIVRATSEEATLIEKNIANNLLTGASASSDGSAVQLTLTGVNPQTGAATSSQIDLPMASGSFEGVPPGVLTRRVLEPEVDFTFEPAAGIEVNGATVEIAFAQPVGDLDTIELFLCLDVEPGDGISKPDISRIPIRITLSKYSPVALLRICAECFSLSNFLDDVGFTMLNTEFSVNVLWDGDVATLEGHLGETPNLSSLSAVVAIVLALALFLAQPEYAIKTEEVLEYETEE